MVARMEGTGVVHLRVVARLEGTDVVHLRVVARLEGYWCRAPVSGC